MGVRTCLRWRVTGLLRHKQKGKTMTNKWMFNTTRCVSQLVGAKALWQGHIELDKSVGVGRVAADVANRLHMDVFNVLNVYQCTDDEIIRRIRQGQTVNMELFGFSIQMTGSLGASNADFDSSRNALVVRAYTKSRLRDCLSDVVPRNTTHGLKASIISVQDNVALEEGVITVPSKVLVGGKNLLIGGNADEWCRLLAQNGEVAATPTVLENTGGTLDLDFGELPPDGTYTLVVSARNGASTDLAPAIARKTVVIKNNQ